MAEQREASADPTLDDIADGYHWLARSGISYMQGVQGYARDAIRCVPVDTLVGASALCIELGSSACGDYLDTLCAETVIFDIGGELRTKFSQSSRHVTAELFELAAVSRQFDVVFSWLHANATPLRLLPELFFAYKQRTSRYGQVVVAVLTDDMPRSGWADVQGEQPRGVVYQRVYQSIPSDRQLTEAIQAAGLRVVEQSEVAQPNGRPETSARIQVYRCAPADERESERTAALTAVKVQELVDGDQAIAIAVLSAELDRTRRLYYIDATARVNRAILFDVLAAFAGTSSQSALLDALDSVYLNLFLPDDSETDFDIWWSLGTLFHKAGEYAYAIRCLDRAITIEPTDYRAYLRRGYCFEALEQFDDAIRTTITARNLMDRTTGITDDERAEVQHALGHFYAGASHIGVDEPDESRFRMGLEHMVHACASGNGLDYVSCLGSMFSEREQYQLALFWYDWAEARLTEDPAATRREEVAFYRAVALLGAGQYEPARDVLERVRTWAVPAGDWDAVAHVDLYVAKSRITGLTGRPPSSAELDQMFQTIVANPPSRYAVEGMRRDRHAFLAYLRAFEAYQRASEGEMVDWDQLEESIQWFYRFAHTAQIPLDPVHVVRSRGVAGVAQVLSEVERLQVATIVEEFDTWCTRVVAEGDVRSSVVIVAEDDHNQAMIAAGIVRVAPGANVLYTDEASLGVELASATSNVVVGSVRGAATLAAANALLITGLRHFNYFQTPLGLAPIGGAPSRLALQAGYLPLIDLSI